MFGRGKQIIVACVLYLMAYTPLFAEAQSAEIVKDYSKWELPNAAKMRLGKGGINDMQFSPDGTQFAVGNDMGIWLYDVKTG